MDKAIAFLQRRASGRAVLLWWIPALVVYLTMLLVTIPEVEAFARGRDLFDLSPTGYSYREALSLLESLGPEGRATYLSRQLPLDFLYPGLFAVAFTLLLTWLFARSFPPDSKIFYLVWVPTLGGLFDYLENLGIVCMVRSFPAVSERMVAASSTFTVLKSTATMLSFVLCAVGLLPILKRYSRSAPPR